MSIVYSITPKGKVLVRFETRWWREYLDETDRLVVLSLYMKQEEPITSRCVAEDTRLSVLEVERSLKKMMNAGYVERKFT